MYRHRFGLAVSFLLTQAATAEVDPDRAKELTDLLVHDCGSCHGTLLKGGLGPPLTADALSQKPLQWIEHVILNGRHGTAMPPWRNLLNPEEAGWLASTLKSGQIHQQ
jgi:cytochrome c55X